MSSDEARDTLPEAAKASVGSVAPDRTGSKKDWFSAVMEKDEDGLKKSVAFELDRIIRKYDLQNYHCLFLLDTVDSIATFHSDRIYAAASQLTGQKDILIFVDSRGGSVEPAYLISKTLKRISLNKFSVAVARRAKSAATLIALGADEIHMGFISQLGPIDPQVGGLPVQALGNALDVIVDLADRLPGSSDLLANYLNQQAPIRVLGYYQRVNESAVQYAERLLANKQLPDGKTALSVADHLVNHYKDHGFVIDLDEAIEVLGSDLIKHNTIEYQAADEIYKFFDFLSFVLRGRWGRECWLVGGAGELGTREIPSTM